MKYVPEKSRELKFWKRTVEEMESVLVKGIEVFIYLRSAR